MKVILVSANTAEMPYPVYPIGMSMVAAAVRQAGHEVTCFDFLQSGRSPQALRQELRRFEPEVVGISIRNVDNVNILNEERYVGGVRQLVQCVRTATGAPVVLGGSGFSIMPERILSEVAADYGVVGEGERIFVRFLNEAEKGHYPRHNTILRDEERIPGRDIPSPAYLDTLLAGYLEEGSIAPVQTKRGCPHRCVYCSYPVLEGRGVRPRDPERVVDDIESLIDEHGVQYVFFTDSVFNDGEGTHMRVVREMNERSLRVPWSAFFNPGGIRPAEVSEMKQSGLQAAELGSDAACDRTLEGQRKPFNWEDVVRANTIFRKAGISTAHYFMFGGPAETPETVQEGIDNIKALECSAAFVFLGIRILPDTALEKIAVEEGLISPGDDLLEPVYFFSPDVEKDVLEQRLMEAFEPLRHVIFPPGAMDDKLQLLHKLGHGGVLWDLLSPGLREEG